MDMPFGYIPHKIKWKNAILKIFGNPNMITRIQAPVIIRMLNPSKKDFILDAGCGGGFFTYEVAKKCQKCIGVDLSINEELLDITRNLSSISFLKADILNMPFKKGTFNKILLSSVLQMVKNDRILLKEIHRVLKKNGVFVLSVPTEYLYIKKLNQIRNKLTKKFKSKNKGFYRYNEIIKLLQKEGFKIMKVEYAPKRLGSFIYETWLYFCYYTGLPLSHPFYFFLYPIAYLDRFSNKRQRGNEIIIKAKKI